MRQNEEEESAAQLKSMQSSCNKAWNWTNRMEMQNSNIFIINCAGWRGGEAGRQTSADKHYVAALHYASDWLKQAKRAYKKSTKMGYIFVIFHNSSRKHFWNDFLYYLWIALSTKSKILNYKFLQNFRKIFKGVAWIFFQKNQLCKLYHI